VAFLRGRDVLVLKESGHPAHIFNPGRAMRLCSADLSPQALKRAGCPRSLVMNRRREAASPYLSKLGAGCSKDGLGQDVPAAARSGQDARAPLRKWRNLRADLSEKGPCLRRRRFFVFPQSPITNNK
jgi:hypothetical protein